MSTFAATTSNFKLYLSFSYLQGIRSGESIPFFIAHANTFFARMDTAFNSSETLPFPYPSGYTFCTPTLATCSWRRRQAPVAVSPPPRPSR